MEIKAIVSYCIPTMLCVECLWYSKSSVSMDICIHPLYARLGDGNGKETELGQTGLFGEDGQLKLVAFY